MTAFKRVLSAAKKTKLKRSKLPKGNLPKGFLAEIMNSPESSVTRFTFDKDDYRIHVSDLISSKAEREFCPRERALNFFEQRKDHVRVIAPGMSLLFRIGHSIHEQITDSLSANKEYRDHMWGRWRCSCGKKITKGFRPTSPANVCKRCNQLPKIYVEYNLNNKEYSIIGHPDLLIKYGKQYYVYEFKSIDRKNIDFDKLESPLGDHVLQASFYAWLLRQEGKEVNNEIRFIYVDRSNKKLFWGNPYKELTSKCAPDTRLEPFLAKAKSLSSSIGESRLPVRICDDISCLRASNCGSSVSCFSRNSSIIDG